MKFRLAQMPKEMGPCSYIAVFASALEPPPPPRTALCPRSSFPAHCAPALPPRPCSAHAIRAGQRRQAAAGAGGYGHPPHEARLRPVAALTIRSGQLTHETMCRGRRGGL